MDIVEVLFIAALATLLGWAMAVAISRGRVIERLRETTGATDTEDVERRVRGPSSRPPTPIGGPSRPATTPAI